MEDPSITKRLIDFGTDEHEYDEVQDLPEESTANNQSLLYNTQNDNNNIVNNNIIAGTSTTSTTAATATNIPTSAATTLSATVLNSNNNNNNNNLDLPPELPPPKQKNSALNSKAAKTKSSSKSSKSKIPRSPSLASTLSYNNFQPPPISGIPPQTPPLPLGYQNKGKSLNPPISPLANNNVSIFTNNSSNNIMAGGSGNSGLGSGGGGLSASNGNAQRNSANMSANSRRPQIQISTPIVGESLKNFQYLTLTVRKDENGYGMKVSGDNPVFVESVKPGGAAQIAGLVAGDMILKVNGTEVRSEKHPTVVSLIKASTIVELAVKRSQKLARPTSVGIVPSTPVLSGRDRTASITGPQPVDSIKRREMETYKIQTLQKMLEQEKLNLERLKGDTNNPSYKLSEANIKKLREQLRQVGAEVLGQTPHNLNHMNKHRRVVSSPDNMHTRHPERQIKTNSGSWELIEKDDEETPPGTPPPPYRHAHSASMSGNEDSMHELGAASTSGIFVESHHFTPLAGAISPPPISHSSRIQAAQTSVTQKEIISMEDEDASDQEGPFIDENGPFNSLQRLLETENVAFLAVFLNYVLSNSEPAPLLFYLITALYKEGTSKDMRKWVYEIHSTFLVPRAPLSWYRQDETLAREVDAVLQNEFDKVEILRKVFWKSRKKARDIICEQLREFQQKRTAGLGTIYGPTDAQLMEAKGDKQKEQHIFEETLMKKLQYLIDEYEKDLPAEDPKKLALCSALSTVIHRTFITRSHPNSIIDRVHHFVSREKSFKSRLMGKKGKMIVRGHPLVLRQYYEVTHCNHCQTIIWGVSPQGFHCTDCKLNIHRPCSKILEENCPGPLPQAKRKDKDLHNDNKISKLIMGKIRPRTSTDMSGDKRQRQDTEDFDPMDFPIERLNSTSIQRHPSDRRTDSANLSIRSNGNTSAHLNASDLQSSFHGADTSMGAMGGGAQGGNAMQTSCTDTTNLTIGALSAVAQQNVGAVSPGGTGALNDINAQDANEGNLRRERLHQQHQQNKSAPVSVNRSESYKERLSHKRNRSQRKTSDPNLTSRPNDDQPDLGLSNSNFTASSNSSLSSGGGSESPSTSMEQMGGAGVATPTATASVMHHHHQHQHSHQDSFHGSIGSSNASFMGGSAAGGQMARHWNFESDEEDDLNEADWSSNVSGEVLASLTDAEKKRQEIINEIYQTERSHVRTLKLLKRLFLFPLQESGLLTQDHLMLLFPPSLSSLCEIHSAFEQKLKQRRIDHNYIVNNVGDLFAEMFDGQSGEELREYAAQFCARQQIALEALKEKRRKDEQLQKLLSKAESHKACRRLQLKDLLPTVLQRLTKYPLLFENLYKVTVRVVPEDTAEAEAIQKALESSKKILVDVNQAVKTAEDTHKLQNIQRKLDKSTFDKDEFKNLDLTQYRLIHDGSLTMKKNPSIQLHGLLFETMIVLLTKQDDKYSLKYLHAARNTDVNNKPVSPIMSIDSETLVRQEAADKNSFFLIKTKTSQMLELRAPSSSECKTWFKHISDAAEQYKPRSKNANQEPVDDPAIATLPHSNTRESLELTPERPPPQSATATLITTPLAPMMPIPSVSQERSGFAQSNNNDVQLRNGRRESTPTSSSTPSDAYPPYYNIKQRLSHNELSPNTNAVNRTMSTRSCGDANHNYSNTSPEFAGANGVTLRHTQSARQSNGSAEDGAAAASGAGVPNKRDSASIVYSNNSNNTRTLMQSSPPLVEPTAIQISISPAHTAEPVLTPAEKLRRLDASIRDGLMEKQKIICDMFRLPVEHFHEIVDIATMPEAPKDSTDIALAAYAQVQSLTEVINDYMKVTPEQEVSAVSTAICDKCHEKRENQAHNRSRSNVTCGKTETKPNTNTSSDTPPPLPPPNKQMAQAQQQTPAPTVTKMQTCALEEANIHEDDDGYCEIDELRLPALPPLTKTPATSTATPPPLPPAAKASGVKQGSPPPPLPPPAGTFKTPPPPPPPPAKTFTSQNQISSTTTTTSSSSSSTNATPELVKRQSTISADSIPEESADEVTHALNDHLHDKIETKSPEIKEVEEENVKINESDVLTKEEETGKIVEEKKKSKTEADEVCEGTQQDDEILKTEPSAPIATIEDEEDKDEDSAMHTAECESAPLEENINEEVKHNDTETKNVKDDVVSPIATTTKSMTAEPQRQNSNATQADEEISLNSEHIEINEAYECLSTINKLNATLSSMVDNSTQTLPLTTSLPVSTSTTIITSTSTNNNNNANTTTTTTSSSGTNPNGHLPTLCGPNRIQHANSLEPSVPCHALSSIVSVLNNQISLLLPKISERDMERERLRKENQHLRELLNAMHERQRVEAKLETPSDITTRVDVVDDETDGFSPATSTTPTPTPTPTVNSVAALGEDQNEIINSNNTSTATTSSSTETTNTVEAQN
ncbi:rho guanine nucleotide exchange factor 2 isoform 3-T3 [Cochliomyia hominivorax]